MPDSRNMSYKADKPHIDLPHLNLPHINLPPADFHMHTVFCDGNNTPAEMAEAAYRKGFSTIGFSAHSAWPVTTGCEMHPDRFQEYRAEICRLEKLYEGRMNIFLGLEIDYIPPVSCPQLPFYSTFELDYSIGSVHYIHNPDAPERGIFAVDYTVEHIAAGIRDVFGGDAKKAVQTYFATEREMIARGGFDIIGHIDLIRKRNSVLSLFSEDDDWYKKELEATADVAAKSGKLVEMNTGGMSRGAIDSPYPSQYMLEILHDHNVPIAINSDAHSTEHIGYAFDISVEAAVKAGYKESFVFTETGWKAFPLV